MQPHFVPGDELLVERVPSARLNPGDVVVFTDPRVPSRRVLKRIARVRSLECFVLGDNLKHSTDSRHYGWVSSTLLLGRVRCFFSKA